MHTYIHKYRYYLTCIYTCTDRQRHIFNTCLQRYTGSQWTQYLLFDTGLHKCVWALLAFVCKARCACGCNTGSLATSCLHACCSKRCSSRITWSNPRYRIYGYRKYIVLSFNRITYLYLTSRITVLFIYLLILRHASKRRWHSDSGHSRK